MIVYSPFWITLKEKKISTYALIKTHGIGSGTLYRIRGNKPLSTNTLDALCYALDCEVQDIIKHEKET